MNWPCEGGQPLGQDRQSPEGYREFLVMVVEKNEKVFRE